MISIHEVGTAHQPIEIDRHKQMAAFDRLPRQLRVVIASADVWIDAASVERLVHRMPPKVFLAQLRALLKSVRPA